MNYLVYIEHAAENLQFFLWYRDYVKRFEALPANERALAPIWTEQQAEAEALANESKTFGPKTISPETAAVFKGTDFAPPKASVVEVRGNPFNTPPRTPNEERDSMAPSEPAWSDTGSTAIGSNKSLNKKAGDAFQNADLKWQPCKDRYLSVQGFQLIKPQSQSSPSAKRSHES